MLEGARTILESWPESKSLRGAIGRVEKALAEDSDTVIDAAKCLVEALCKTVLLELGVTPEKNINIQPLLKLTCNKLGLSEADGGECVRNMVSGMATAIQGIGELRNQHGPMGHGKDAYHCGAEDWQRTMAVKTAEAICVLIHESYRKLPAMDEHSRRPYRPDLDVHDVMDRQAEVEVNEETGEIAINGVVVRPSQILWDYDRIGYIEHKRLAAEAEADWESDECIKDQ